jgi:hypothetical protein
VPFAILTVAAAYAGLVGLIVHWFSAFLAPVVLTGFALRRLSLRTPRRPVAAFAVVGLYAWALDVAMAAGWGLLLDLVALPILGWGLGWEWGGIVWAGPHSGGRFPGVIGVPAIHAMYGWFVGLVAAVVSRVRRSLPPS